MQILVLNFVSCHTAFKRKFKYSGEATAQFQQMGLVLQVISGYGQ